MASAERDLEDPVWQPTDDVDCDDGQHHASHSPTRLSPVSRHRAPARRPNATYSYQHQRVEDADENDWYGKRQRERVSDERLVRADRTSLRPLDRTRRRTLIDDLSYSSQTDRHWAWRQRQRS